MGLEASRNTINPHHLPRSLDEGILKVQESLRMATFLNPGVTETPRKKLLKLRDSVSPWLGGVFEAYYARQKRNGRRDFEKALTRWMGTLDFLEGRLYSKFG